MLQLHWVFGVIGCIIILLSVGWVIWQRSRCAAKIEWEALLARKRADAIAAEGLRRIRGLRSRKFPDASQSSSRLPASFMLCGILFIGASIAILAFPLDFTALPTSRVQESAASPPSTYVRKTTNRMMDLMIRSEPNVSSRSLGRLSPNSTISLSCKTEGGSVNRGDLNTKTWVLITSPYSGWVSGAYVNYDSVPSC